MVFRRILLILLLGAFAGGLTSCHKKRPCPAFDKNYQPDNSPTKYDKHGLVKKKKRLF